MIRRAGRPHLDEVAGWPGPHRRWLHRHAVGRRVGASRGRGDVRSSHRNLPAGRDDDHAAWQPQRNAARRRTDPDRGWRRRDGRRRRAESHPPERRDLRSEDSDVQPGRVPRDGARRPQCDPPARRSCPRRRWTRTISAIRGPRRSSTRAPEASPRDRVATAPHHGTFAPLIAGGRVLLTGSGPGPPSSSTRRPSPRQPRPRHPGRGDPARSRPL